METAEPSPYVSTIQEGVERVREGHGNYAFLVDYSTIEYVTERQCDLTQVGGLLNTQGFAFALPQGKVSSVTHSKRGSRIQPRILEVGTSNSAESGESTFILLSK